ncbi:MAG: MCE family protein [Desulfonatronovibrio sp. MSAO_Bac4]|nr:MAG: MCE family protein [Desulfonatronovibrio sp. MSAO_Bac4]
MRTSPNYYTIGIFVSTGIILLFGALIILGAGALWRTSVTIETYVDESIQGIDVGSQVKMRGVQIGNVQQISFVNIRYPQATTAEKRYVLLEISLSLNAFGDMTPDEFETFLAREVLSGLRIRMMPMGITGSAYIEMDYLDPLRHPSLPVDWTPENPYVPSAPGTFARLEETFESLGNTMAKLQGIDLRKTLDHVDQLIVDLNSAVKSFDLQGLTHQTSLFLEELRQSNQQISKLLGPDQATMDQNINIYTMLYNTNAAIKEIRQGISSFTNHEKGDPFDHLAETIANFRAASEDLPATMESIRGAAGSLQQSSTGINRLTRRTYSLMGTQNEKIESIMRDMEITSRNLMELTTDAKRYPSYILFGDKPKDGELK